MKPFWRLAATRLATALLCGAVTATDVAGQTPVTPPAATPTTGESLTARADALLSRRFNAARSAGLAAAVVAEGKVVWMKALGVANVDTGAPVTTSSLFHLASVTKPVVATAILQLVEQGKLGLDDPVVRHLPYFRLADANSTTITLRQLLTHTSGLPDVEDYDWDQPEYDDEALERWVKSLASRKMRSPPGTAFAYSNIGFEVLADVIAKVTEMPFEDWIAAAILEPVAMKSSTLLNDAVDRERLVAPHAQGPTLRPFVRPVFPYNRRHAASSTLYSSVEDLSRWMVVNLARGTIDDQRILAATTYDQLWRPGSAVTDRIGLGWFLADREGVATVFHSGGDEGFRSDLILAPDRKIGVVVLANCDGTDVGAVANDLLTLFLDEKAR
ncbi:MAG: serine hydrolase domain-containing protein [Kofleriaceae bacterium]